MLPAGIGERASDTGPIPAGVVRGEPAWVIAEVELCFLSSSA